MDPSSTSGLNFGDAVPLPADAAAAAGVTRISTTKTQSHTHARTHTRGANTRTSGTYSRWPGVGEASGSSSRSRNFTEILFGLRGEIFLCAEDFRCCCSWRPWDKLWPRALEPSSSSAKLKTKTNPKFLQTSFPGAWLDRRHRTLCCSENLPWGTDGDGTLSLGYRRN